MKTLISIFAVFALLVATAPSFATYYCKVANAKGESWTHYSMSSKHNAKVGALTACMSGNTNNPSNCKVVSCWQN